MSDPGELHSLITTALTGVVKQIKAVRYYPPKHPALEAAAKESLHGFEPLFASGNHLSLAIKREGFLFDDMPVAKNNQVLGQLASFCFARRIQYLTFLSQLNSSDLNHFVHYILLDPQIIQKHGGIQAILEKARITTIWANIRDLAEVLERKEEIEDLAEEPDFDPAAVLGTGDEIEAGQEQPEVVGLESLLKKMEQEQSDTRFHQLTQELIPLLRIQLNTECRPLVLRAYLLLCRCASGKQHSQERAKTATEALNQLTTDDMTGYLAEFVFDEQTEKKTRETLIQILVFLAGKTATRLMDLLASESSASKRKLLNEILIRSGTSALPVINQSLEDERWYVVRNAIAIIGDIRSQESLAQLPPLLQHDDIRVRRETIRALTKIGGKRAIKILLQTAIADDQELRRQAILSLGAIRAASAVPTLLEILRKSDWSQRAIDLKKDAIRALGEIRDPQATPELSRTLARKSWMRRKLNDELRIAAASALGDIADKGTRGLLEKMTSDRSAAVARASAQALKQLDKANQ